MIPTENDWKQIPFDLDDQWAFDMFFGKSSEEAKKVFYRNPLERSFDLAYMAKVPFQYYFKAFRDYVLDGNFPYLDLGASYTSFFEAFCQAAKKRPNDLRPILIDVIELVQYIADNQKALEIDEDIFGNYQKMLSDAISNLSE